MDDASVERWRGEGLSDAVAALGDDGRGPCLRADARGCTLLSPERWSGLRQQVGEAALPLA